MNSIRPKVKACQSRIQENETSETEKRKRSDDEEKKEKKKEEKKGKKKDERMTDEKSKNDKSTVVMNNVNETEEGIRTINRNSRHDLKVVMSKSEKSEKMLERLEKISERTEEMSGRTEEMSGKLVLKRTEEMSGKLVSENMLCACISIHSQPFKVKNQIS